MNKTNLLIILIFNTFLSFGQELIEPAKSLNEQMRTSYKAEDYENAMKLIDSIINNSNINSNLENPANIFDKETQKTFLYNKYKIAEKLNDWETSMSCLEKVIKMGGSISSAYGANYDRYDLAKLYLKVNEKSSACDELKIVSNFIYDYDGRYKERHKEAMKFKDSVCGEYLAQKDFDEKKAINPHYGNQAPAFSLLGAYEDDVEKILGKSTGKYLEHRGKDSYDAYVYKTKFGEYRIAFRNGSAFVIWYYPSVKQKFIEDELWTGGMFNIENDYLNGGAIGTSSSGFVNGVNYYSIDYDYDNYEQHSITFYGKKDGYVNKILIF